ncbi:MAG: crossover junction endodeoxyribonuclease RuvC [Candidatus Poribacteria bacterium]|nr:crossover junction endodeoxyribonuclease RuvC [Candidatus Poribacteria bacterium]MDE0325218.1 crossover junction endodeoxyribonuclease RuvC [Candidatus Poribacteria bacterium]
MQKSPHPTERNTKKIILGIDPGIANTGYGVVESHANQLTPRDFGNIRTSPETASEVRLKQIYDAVTHLIAKFAVENIVLEDIFFSKNVSSAFAVGEVKGIVKLAAANADCPIALYTPTQVKQAIVGYGRATKSQMQKMAQALLQLKEPPRPDHAADALALALCHARSYKVLELQKKYTQ